MLAQIIPLARWHTELYGKWWKIILEQPFKVSGNGPKGTQEMKKHLFRKTYLNPVRTARVWTDPQPAASLTCLSSKIETPLQTGAAKNTGTLTPTPNWRPMASSQERQGIRISHSDPCYPWQGLRSGWVWPRDGSRLLSVPSRGRALPWVWWLSMQGPWWRSPQPVCKAERDASKKNRDCSFPSFLRKHQDPKAGVSPQRSMPLLLSAQRFYPEGEIRYFEALPKRTEFVFNRKLRMFKPKGMLKNNGWCDEN